MIQTVSEDLISVLVADDDPVFRSTVTACLTGRMGRATEARDGVEAWQLLLTRSFDLAVVDLSMPNLDGFALIRHIRANARTRYLPIVVVTARHDAVAVDQALGAGATAFLTKPVDWLTFGSYLGGLMQLAASDRRARGNERKSQVIARVNETLLAHVCTEIMHSANDIRRAFEAQMSTDDHSSYVLSRSKIIDRGIKALGNLDSVAQAAEKFSQFLAE